MNSSKEFNNILDECLERLLVKGETVEQCLESYPEHAAELEPLLHTVVAANKALSIKPLPEFKARARCQLNSLLQEVKPKRRLPVLGWQPRWAMALAVFLALLLAGGGTAMAAENSMPDSLLYPVKLTTEQVRLTLTRSDIGKAELCATLADRRVAEIAYLVNKGKHRQVEQIAQRLDKHLTMITSLSLAEKAGSEVLSVPAPAPPQPQAEREGKGAHAMADRRTRLRVRLGQYANDHPAKLQALLDRAPESAKPALQRTISLSVASYKKALEDLD